MNILRSIWRNIPGSMGCFSWDKHSGNRGFKNVSLIVLSQSDNSLNQKFLESLEEDEEVKDCSGN